MPDAQSPAGKVADDDRENETQSQGRRTVHDFLSSDHEADSIGKAYFGAGLANLAASMGTFGWISLSTVVDLPSNQVTVTR
jgi:hypothetical protein